MGPFVPGSVQGVQIPYPARSQIDQYIFPHFDGHIHLNLDSTMGAHFGWQLSGLDLQDFIQLIR
jgi:hypothetical protein